MKTLIILFVILVVLLLIFQFVVRPFLEAVKYHDDAELDTFYDNLNY